MTADGTASSRPTRITFFAVPPEADEAFRAAWARDGEGVLHRALREDAPYRYVAFAPAQDGPDLYEIAAESDRPDVEGGVLLIEPVEDAAAWGAAPVGHRGYIGRRLYRSLDGHGQVGVTRWSSPLMVARARLGGPLYTVVHD